MSIVEGNVFFYFMTFTNQHNNCSIQMLHALQKKSSYDALI